MKKLSKLLLAMATVAFASALAAPTLALAADEPTTHQVGTADALKSAAESAVEGDTIELNADIENAGSIVLKPGVTLDGKGKYTLKGNTSIRMASTGESTVKDVKFASISNGNNLSAIYANLTADGAKATITGCAFDGVDWDAIQATTPDELSGVAEFVITGNSFRGEAKRYIHVEGWDETVKLTVTGNKLADGATNTPLGVWYVYLAEGSDLSGNYVEDPSSVSVGLGSYNTKEDLHNASELVLPLKDADLSSEISYPVKVVTGTWSADFYQDVVAAASEAEEGDLIVLLQDAELTGELSTKATIVVPEGVRAVADGLVLTMNAELDDMAFLVEGEMVVRGNTKIDSVDCGYNFLVGKANADGSLVKGALTIEGGEFYGLTTVAQVTAGTLDVKGGSFKVENYNPDYNYKYTLNCKDAYYDSGDAVITVTGGTFYKFDPADNLSEGTGTNYVPATHASAADDDNYVVSPRTADNAEAAVGSACYATLEAAIEAANEADDGSTVTLLKGVTIADDTREARINVTGEVTVDFAGNTITMETDAVNNWAAFYVNGGELTLVDSGTGGGIKDTSGSYCLHVENEGTLNVQGGTYHGATTAVNVNVGAANIEGGAFSVTPYGGSYRYMLNCIDASYRNGTAVIAVTGGTFEKFDPSNSDSENPRASFVPAGYESVAEGDSYKVSGIDYAVKFDANGGSGAMEDQSLEYGVEQALKANAFTRSGYAFAGWNTAADGAGTDFANNAAVKNLSIDGTAVTLYAQWTYVPPASPGSTSTTVTIPVSGEENTVHAEVTVTGSSVAVTPLDEAEIESVVGDDVQTGVVKIDLSAMDSDVTEVTLPVETLDAITKAAEDAGNDTESIQIVMPQGTVEIDDASMRAVLEQAEGDEVRLVLENTGNAQLNDEQKSAIEGEEIHGGFEAYFECVETGKRIGDFKGGTATLSVPFQVPEGKKGSGFSVWYVSDGGDVEKMKTFHVNGQLKWHVPHMSDYVVVYEDHPAYEDCEKGSDCPLASFPDVKPGAWYHDGLHWAVESGALKGGDDGRMSPNQAIDRQMLMVILHRYAQAAGMNTAVYEDTSILPYNDDEDVSAYAVTAMRWAVGSGVMKGHDNGDLAPQDALTREQLATFLHRFAGYLGMDASAGEEADVLPFADAGEISEYAIPAMQWACASGVILGYDDGSDELGPKDDCTRAQAATMLMRFDAIA